MASSRRVIYDGRPALLARFASPLCGSVGEDLHDSMDNMFVAAALLSAVLHAAWNAAVKASPRPAQAMTAQMLVSALLAVPALIWTGLPTASAWPWMIASTLLNMGAVAALLRGYTHAGFGIVYPMARA